MEDPQTPREILNEDEDYRPVLDSAPNRTNIDKEYLISLLKKHCLEDLSFLEDSKIAADDVIVSLERAKVKVNEGFFTELANEIGVRYVSAKEIRRRCHKGHQGQFATVLPYRFLKESLILPFSITENDAEIATANPLNSGAKDIVEMLLGERRIRWYVTSTDTVVQFIESAFGEIHKKQALSDLRYRNPEESAHIVLEKWQKYAIVTILLVAIAAFAVESSLTFIALFSLINIIYFSINPIKFYISIRGLKGSRKIANSSDETLKSLDEKSLPVYTILVPVYHESHVLPQVMKNIYRMDYPKDKLDVKILIEEKDTETLHEAKNLGLFGKPTKGLEGLESVKYREFLEVFEPVIIPKADIMTKPRACNYGLIRAIGEYCVIYDAEDNPDPDQLKKSAAAFSSSKENVACLQSRLNFYNAKENLLTRWFSIEYSYWYDYYLEGLDQVGAPIPLGGTSNHFRTKQLRDLGSWDPYNVTEDADLGIRISRRNLKTAMIDSHTYEEAPTRLRSWIKQRSRWYKGHLQTYLVHMRHPRKLREEMGVKKFLYFQLTFGGAIFMPLINPMLWLVTLITAIFPGTFHSLFSYPVQQICIFNLIAGNMFFILMYAVACVREKKYSYVPLSILMPIYWILISIGAWRGLTQLIRKPFYWEKTDHGISKIISK